MNAVAKLLCGWAWCASAVALSAGCGGDATVESDPALAQLPQTQLICDGSDEIRFVAASGGGGRLALEDVFGGAQFITIDGQCRFWVRERSVRGLRTGVLDAAFAAQLSSALHIGEYASLQAYRSPVCPDAGSSRIWDGHDTLEEICGSPPDAPAIWSDPFRRVGLLYDELDQMSSAAWDKTRIISLRGPQRPDDVQPFTWTASLDLDSVAVGDEAGVDSSVLVDDAPTLAVLADLRLAAYRTAALVAVPGIADQYLFRGLFVIDAQDREFQVLLRDEPPDAIARAARFELEGQ